MSIRFWTGEMLVYILFFCIKEVASLEEPKDLVGNVVGNMTFKWTATPGTIATAEWGLYDSDFDSVSPVFLTAINGSGVPIYSPALDNVNNVASRYKGRVHFIGDISQGRAWFYLTNLTLNDTNEYAVALSSGALPKTYSVKLNVAVAPTTVPPPTQTPPNATVTEATLLPTKKVVSERGETAKLVSTVDVGINNTWVNATIYRNKNESTYGEDIIIDLKKSDNVKNKYLSKREKDIDLVVQGTSNMVNVTFTLQNLTTNDTMFYRMSLVNSNHETFIQYTFLRVSDCSTRDCKNEETPTPGSNKGAIIAGSVCAAIALCGACAGGGCYCYKKSDRCCPCCPCLCCRQRSDQNDGKGDVPMKNKVDNEGSDNQTQPSA